MVRPVFVFAAVACASGYHVADAPLRHVGGASSAHAAARGAALTSVRMVEMEEDQIPKRWAKVPECERPKRWREKFDEDDCKIYFEHGEDAMLGKVSIDSDGVSSESHGSHVSGGATLETSSGSDNQIASGKSRRYTEVIASLNTTDDLLKASARSSDAARLIVVKFYSKKCRMCYRIAAKYRRLALDYAEEIDCYEAASDDARELFEALEVTQVPSIQIFDGRRVTRLANFAAKPTEWKRLLGKVETAMKSIKSRRTIHDVFGTPLIDSLKDGTTHT